jgi:hypothetical protein
MPSAEEVAAMLSYEFLKEGRYTAASGPEVIPQLAEAAGAAMFGAGLQEGELLYVPGKGLVSVRSESPESFAGLAVQSVGFEEGTAEPAVHIYLTHGSARLIKSLPKEVEGVPVRTHKMGAITIRPEQASTATNHGHFFERNDRICCGSSVAPTSEDCSGTLGALVKRTGSQGIYLLSNNHVFAGCNHVPKDQPILSPSSNDGRPTIKAPAEIGRHDSIHELRSGSPNFINPCDTDIALARSTDPTRISSWQGDVFNGYDTPHVDAAPLSMMEVKKFGRTTGLTRGVVEAKVTTPMPVTYSSRHFKGVVWFRDVWTIRATDGPFALPGDSGSLVVNEDGDRAIGLVFAASRNGEYAWIIPMPCIVGSFGGLQLVSGHGI